VIVEAAIFDSNERIDEERRYVAERNPTREFAVRGAHLAQQVTVAILDAE
jgi:hypothetical protein